MKYKLISSEIGLGYIFSIFEVVGKQYLLIRVYRGELYLGQFWSSPMKWTLKAEAFMKGGA